MQRGTSIDRSTMRLFWEAASRQKYLLFIAAGHSLGTVLLSAAVPMLIGKMIASLTYAGGDPFSYLPALIGLAAVGAAGNRFGFKAIMKVQARGARYPQQRGLDALLQRSVGYHNNNVGGKLVSDAVDLPNSFIQIVSSCFLNLIPFALVLVVGSVLVFTQSLLLGAIITCMSILTIGSGVIERRWRDKFRQRQIEATKAVTAHTADTILNVQTVKTFAREERELAANDKVGVDLANARLNNWLAAGTQGNYRILALSTMQIVLTVFIINLTRDNPQLLGTAIFAFSFTIMMSARLFEINVLLRNIDDALLHAAPMTRILSEKPEVVDAPNAPKLQVTKGEITIKNVTFHYPDNTNQSVFSRLDTTLTPGEKIGLVGPSGGGKSTLTRLLLRFEDINSGEILIDGQNIARVTQASLREAIAYVPQEPLLFHRSIRENISYGRPGACLKDVQRAAHLAYADEFIDTLPNGYDTVVGERGVKLSGGQRQRIAVARAVLKDAPILILDEATSALDSESEKLIQAALKRLMEKRTTLVVAHRLSTIQKMDRIIVLEKGKISEEGTHAALLKKKGTYAKLWAHQSGGFLEG